MAENHPILKSILEETEGFLEEKAEVEERKRVVDAKVEALLEAARAVQKVYGGTIPESMTTPQDPALGVTAHIREIMKTSGATAWLLPAQVKTFLEQRKFPVEKYSNPMAIIHQVLKRLEDQGEITKNPNGQHYMWKTK